MGHLLPQLPRCPAHRVPHRIVFDHMAPTAVAAFRAEQLLQPFVAQHQHRVGVEDQQRLLCRNAALLKLLRLQQMQVILLAVALEQLVRMGRAEQLTALGPVSLFSAHVSRLGFRTRRDHRFGADLGTHGSG